MTGTLSSFNSALNALRYQRVAMDVASNNIANVTTNGYVRRRAEASALGAPVQAAMWSRYEGAGDGVASASITRMADVLLDTRARREHGQQSYLDTRVEVLNRVEAGVGEPSGSGVAAALADFRNAWQDLEAHPELLASRGQVLATGQAVADALRTQAGNIDTEMSDQRGHMIDVISEVNAAARDLGRINQSIAEAQPFGLDDSDLRDQRDVLAMRLSELTGAVATGRPDGGFDVTVGGVPLVLGKDAAAITITSGIAADGSADGSPLAFAVVAASGTTPLPPATVGGVVGATSELLTTTLPNYLAGLDSVAALLADSVNTLHTSGYDLDGNAGKPFFTYAGSATNNPAGAARSLTVAITDPRGVAASSLAGAPNLDGGIAAALGNVENADADYQRLINSLGTEVSSSIRQGKTQQLMTAQVDMSREQLAGVNFDEETVNLLAAQRAYEAASRVISTIDAVLDTLINRTGIVR
jgi:flagellar hook-associated protein 1 FlgK